MRKVKVHYPWTDTPVKGVFFVPTLRLAEIKKDGLSAALHYNIKAKAEEGAVDGKLGILFTRVR
jgi:hypothetical protein